MVQSHPQDEINKNICWLGLLTLGPFSLVKRQCYNDVTAAQGWPRVFPVHKVRECLLSYYQAGGVKTMIQALIQGWRGGVGRVFFIVLMWHQ